MNYSRWFVLLLFILVFKAILIGIFIHSGKIGLGPDEAQYWTWSNHLDWGYYSKPPGIAWQIWLGTQLFGDTELGVRFFSIIWGTLLSLSVFILAKTCNLNPIQCFTAALVMAFSPIGFLASFLAITDGGQVFFWTVASIFVCDALRKNVTPNYLLIGILIACGALFKWNIYLFWLIILILIPFYKNLLDGTVIVGMVISLLGLIPSLIWNWSHNWVTFRHVGIAILGGNKDKKNEIYKWGGNFFEFIGAQFILLSPIFFALLLISFWHLFKNRKQTPPPIVFCGLTGLTVLSAFLILSIFQKIQGNWCDFIYPSCIVFLTWYSLQQKNWHRLVITGLITSILLIVLTLIFSDSIDYKFNPFKHNLGWSNLAKSLEKAGYNPKKDFLFSDKYQTTSELSFYGPQQRLAYFFNLQGSRKNQFSFWPSMAQQQKGNSGFYVLVENAPHLEKITLYQINEISKELLKFFKSVDFQGRYPLVQNQGITVKEAFIFKGIEYNGKDVINPQKY